MGQLVPLHHGARTQVFNVGSYRRKMMPKKVRLSLPGCARLVTILTVIS
jgi:hypothetical protein